MTRLSLETTSCVLVRKNNFVAAHTLNLWQSSSIRDDIPGQGQSNIIIAPVKYILHDCLKIRYIKKFKTFKQMSMGFLDNHLCYLLESIAKIPEVIFGVSIPKI